MLISRKPEHEQILQGSMWINSSFGVQTTGWLLWLSWTTSCGQSACGCRAILLFYLLWLVSTGENDLSPSHKHSPSTRCLKSWSISEKLIKWICWVCFPYPSKSCYSACKWQNQQERGLETRHVCSFAGSSWAVYREMHLFISSKPPSSST